MAAVQINPKRRKRRRNKSRRKNPARAITTRTNRRRRRRSRSKRRTNPFGRAAAMRPTRVNRRRRRRNPFSLGRLTGGGVVSKAIAGLVGFFGAKSLDFFNRGWTWKVTGGTDTADNATPAQKAWREPIKDAAATAAAVVAYQIAKRTGLFKGENAQLVLVGGLCNAVNRGIRGRALGANAPAGSFAAHLLGDDTSDGLGDYLTANGGELFDHDFLGSSDAMYEDDDSDDSDLLGDYVTEDDA